MESRRKILTRYRSGESIRSISRELTLSRNTVRAIVRIKGSPPVGYERKSQPLKALGAYKDRLEILLRDTQRSRPQRTIKQLFLELQSYGYEGSYSAVGRYASSWKRRVGLSTSDAYVPLYFEPGSAYQFDWSHEKVLLNGEAIPLKVAHFILCYSRKRFVIAYYNETQEMVLDAHVKAFAYFGGVPLKGIYDNMKTAVLKILKGGEREWTPVFEKLCCHYRVDPVACSPARGNEKGRVERQVSTDRQQFFTPLLQAESLSELNDILLSRVSAYNNTHKHPDYKDQTIEEVFEQERSFLIAPPFPFDGYKQSEAKVSKTCLVRYDGSAYSVDYRAASDIVQVKAYADRIKFIYQGQEVGDPPRSFTKGGTYYNWLHYIPLLKRKPGALRNGAPFYAMDLPEGLTQVRERLKKFSSSCGDRDFAYILSYITSYSLEAVEQACQDALKGHVISKDIILNSLTRQGDGIAVHEEEISARMPSLAHPPQVDLTAYDRLMGGN